MTKQRLYHSNFNHNGFRSGKANKSRAHNLRASNALKKELKDICSPELIQENVLFIDGKKVDALQGNDYLTTITKTLEKEKRDYVAKLESAYTDTHKAELSGGRAKAKAALKRYSDGSTDQEKTFWNDMTEKLGKEPINAEKEIETLKSTSSKIKRFKQKKSRLEELEKYNNLLNVKSRNTQYTVFSKEMVYKIPDNTDLDISAIDFVNFANNMNKKLYPDFRCTYLVVHCDENIERKHVHTELSGLNLKTGEMDIQQQLFINLEKQYKLNNKDFELSGKSYNSLNNQEIKRFGELYQDFIFEETNKYMLKKGYNINLEKRTELEKKEDLRVFVKNISTQDREFTRKNKLQEENKKSFETLKENKKLIVETSIKVSDNLEKIDKTDFELQKKQEELSITRIKIKDAYKNLNKLEKTTLNVKSALDAAIDFAKNPKVQIILEYKEHFQKIRDEKISQKLAFISENIQPTEEQEQEIRNVTRQRSGLKRP